MLRCARVRLEPTKASRPLMIISGVYTPCSPSARLYACCRVVAIPELYGSGQPRPFQ